MSLVKRVKKLEVLENTKALMILIALLVYERIQISRINNSVGGSLATIYRTVKLLEKADIIERERVRGFPERVYVKLTKKGRKVALKVSEILRILEEGKKEK